MLAYNCCFNTNSEPIVLSDSPSGPSLVLILKWGGELTPAGRLQAEELGRIFRCMYPGGGCKTDTGAQGLGLLRLHSTFRHDLKIYASDEGEYLKITEFFMHTQNFNFL